MNLCAERVAALNMYVNSGQTKIKRLIVFRDKAPFGGRQRYALRSVPRIFVSVERRKRKHGNYGGLREQKNRYP